MNVPDSDPAWANAMAVLLGLALIAFLFASVVLRVARRPTADLDAEPLGDTTNWRL